jgi:Reverse transcriptase (RNA-dependent DNA polymerase)
MEEIHISVFSMGADKSPGPNDFSMSFYQTYWDIIKSDLFSMFENFFKGTLDIAKLIRATLCLILKVSNASLVIEFRPIALLNCSYKIFSKVLANRLQVVLNDIIGDSQSAFLKGRYILVCVVNAYEVLHQVHKDKDEGLLFKVDFQKAFDYVNWTYLLDLFVQRGFDPLWFSLMKKLLCGGRVNILVNRELTGYFECRRRVRQGDLLSSYLFILAADGLNKMIQRGIMAGHLEGLGPSSISHGKILHLQYADDTLIFLKENATMVENLK